MTVPLRHRLPNPPVPFVGRAVEVERLARVLERGAVAFVWGFSGIGKTALVLQVAQHRVQQRWPADRSFVVDGSRDAVAAIRDRLRSFGKSVGDDVSSVVEALEDGGLFVVVDDLARVEGDLVEFVELAARVYRNARVVCVCREDPRKPAWLAQTVALSPMALDELTALLLDVQPGWSASEAHATAAQARGSPWRALQLSVGGVVDTSGPERSLLSLSLSAQGVLRALALTSAAVPLPVLAKATRLPPDDVTETLCRRGWLERSPRGLRLHHAARAVVTPLIDKDERALRGKKLLDAVLDAHDAAADDDRGDLAAAAASLVDEFGDVADRARLGARLTLTAQPAPQVSSSSGEEALAAGRLDDARRCFADASLASRVGRLQVRLIAGALEDIDAEVAAVALLRRQSKGTDDEGRRFDRVVAVLASLRGTGLPRAALCEPALGDVVARFDDARACLDAALRVRGAALDEGRSVAALEAAVVARDAAIVVADHAAVAALGRAISAEAAAVGSARFAAEAVDVAADVAAWVGRAGINSNPVVARRARAVLGDVDVELDVVDRAVVAAVRQTSAFVSQRLGTGASPEWTIDAKASRIVLADGRAIDFASRKVLFDLLLALCRRGGASSKEQLLADAWGVRDYHPLQHDNRLKVAVRKLRVALDEVFGDAPVESVDDGYRLIGRVRFIG